MKYIQVKWHHDFADEPIQLFSELDDKRDEMRKVEIFRDGKLSFASAALSKGPAKLSVVPLPENAEIATDPQFEVSEISLAAFEQVWLRAVSV